MKKTTPILLLILLFVGAAWYSLTKEPEPVHELIQPEPPPAAPVTWEGLKEMQPDAVVEGYFEPEPVIEPDPLPTLDQSDAEITQDLAGVLGTDATTEYLVRDQTISRLVATIDSLTSRQVPPMINPVKATEDKFIFETEGEMVVLSPQNFARYNAYVSLMQNSDSDALIAIYHHYTPLFQTAWEENGGEGPFNDRLLEVIDQLLETPDVSEPIHLTRYEAVYLFEEPELEALSAGQKILLRMGRVNAELVKEKLAEIRAGLMRNEDI